MTSIYAYGDREAAIITLRRISTFIDSRLSGLVAADDELAAAYQTAQAGIAAETAETEPSLVVLAGYLQSAIRQPALAAGQLDDRLEAFAGLADDCLSILDVSETTGYSRWQVLTAELAIAAILTSMSRIITTSTPDSRAHAITTAADLLTRFTDYVEALDTISRAFEALDLDARYFSQSTTYTIAARLVATCVRYLLKAAYDLRVEKRFTVREPTAPIVLAIREYPNVEIEPAMDLLIRANALTGDEILLLEPGREIVIYI